MKKCKASGAATLKVRSRCFCCCRCKLLLFHTTLRRNLVGKCSQCILVKIYTQYLSSETNSEIFEKQFFFGSTCLRCYVKYIQLLNALSHQRTHINPWCDNAVDFYSIWDVSAGYPCTSESRPHKSGIHTHTQKTGAFLVFWYWIHFVKSRCDGDRLKPISIRIRWNHPSVAIFELKWYYQSTKIVSVGSETKNAVDAWVICVCLLQHAAGLYIQHSNEGGT